MFVHIAVLFCKRFLVATLMYGGVQNELEQIDVPGPQTVMPLSNELGLCLCIAVRSGGSIISILKESDLRASMAFRCCSNRSLLRVHPRLFVVT